MITSNRRKENLLKAIHALNLEDDFTAHDLVDRTAGLRVKEPGNVQLHGAIVDAMGREYNAVTLGQLLGRMACKTFGDWVLVPESTTRVPARYGLFTVDELRREAMSDLTNEQYRAVIERERTRWKVEPEEVMRLASLRGIRHDRALKGAVARREKADAKEQAEADRAKVAADPELRETFRAMRKNIDGRSDIVEQQPAKDFHAVVTGADGIDQHGRRWDVVDTTKPPIDEFAERIRKTDMTKGYFDGAGFFVPNGASGTATRFAPVGADFVRACQIRNSRLGGN